MNGGEAQSKGMARKKGGGRSSRVLLLHLGRTREGRASKGKEVHPSIPVGQKKGGIDRATVTKGHRDLLDVFNTTKTPIRLPALRIERLGVRIHGTKRKFGRRQPIHNPSLAIWYRRHRQFGRSLANLVPTDTNPSSPRLPNSPFTILPTGKSATFSQS